MRKKIFSGVQPTGNLHLGNYLGAIKNFVSLNNATNSIIPTKNNNMEVANEISNFDEDVPQIINLNTGNKNNQSSGAQVDPSGDSVSLPAIAFDTNNTHTMYATALTGVS